MGPRTLTADEPRPISTDIGPTPGELLLAALGSCTSMTVRAFADRHSWPLDQVDVTVRFDIKELLAVAGPCPVQRLLTKGASIVTVPTVVAKPPASRSRTLPQ
ncbi:OsmC family protein [Streptomyces sp. NBC_00445]|uniref:OsmC family protein n=1 Tax=Streptomyces sp. NBC_00445 TaxID=2975745 RepID=UPI002E1A5702